jgi:hypothetical protein
MSEGGDLPGNLLGVASSRAGSSVFGAYAEARFTRLRQ